MQRCGGGVWSPTSRRKQRVSNHSVRIGGRRQELACASIRSRHLQGLLRAHHRRHVPARDHFEQTCLHAIDHRHHGQSPISGYATPQHPERTRVHSRLLHNQLSVARRTQVCLQKHC